jgi:hypothetical protein
MFVSVMVRLAGVLDLYFEKKKDQNLDVVESTARRGSSPEEGPSLLNITGRLSMRAGEMSWMVCITPSLLCSTLSSFSSCRAQGRLMQ